MAECRFVMGTASVGSKITYPFFCRLAEEAQAHGISAFDTAPLYGRGLAQKYLAAYLKKTGKMASEISTKVGWLPAVDLRTALLLMSRGEILHGLSLPWRKHSMLAALDDEGIAAGLAYARTHLHRQHFDTVFLHAPVEDVLANPKWTARLKALGTQANAVGLAEPTAADVQRIASQGGCEEAIQTLQISAQTFFANPGLAAFKGELWVNAIIRFARSKGESFTDVCHRIQAVRPERTRLLIGFNHLELFDQLAAARLL